MSRPLRPRPILNHPRRIAAGVVAVVAGALLVGVLLVPVSFGAAATGPPRFEKEREEGLPRFFSTRAQIVFQLYAGTSSDEVDGVLRAWSGGPVDGSEPRGNLGRNGVGQ